MSTPLSVALRMVSAAMSMTVSAPASASNSTVVVDRKVRLAGRAGAVGQVEDDAVVVDGDERGAFGGLVASQIGKCHASNLVVRLVAGRRWSG